MVCLASLTKTSSRTRPSSDVIHPRCNDDRLNRAEPSRRVVRPHERVPGLFRLHVPDHGTRQGLLGADPISLFEDLVDVYWRKLEPRARWRAPGIIVLSFRRVECNGRCNVHRTLRAPDIVMPSSTDFAMERVLSNVASARAAISASSR